MNNPALEIGQTLLQVCQTINRRSASKDHKAAAKAWGLAIRAEIRRVSKRRHEKVSGPGAKS